MEVKALLFAWFILQQQTSKDAIANISKLPTTEHTIIMTIFVESFSTSRLSCAVTITWTQESAEQSWMQMLFGSKTYPTSHCSQKVESEQSIQFLAHF